MRKMNENMFGTEFAMAETRAQKVARAQQGVWHRHRVAPAMPQADDTPTITVEVAVDQAVAAVQCVLTEPEARTVPLMLVDTRWNTLTWRYIQTWEATLPAYSTGTIVRYTVEALPRDGSASIPADDGETFSYLVGAGGAPAWSEEARIYQIFVDRFNPGAGRDWPPTDDLARPFGGTLRGIIEKLDYLADLGINCVWITPIFPDKSSHGYHPLDYFAVNPRMGSLEDVRELLREAHARGIRVLLDFVANHMGRDHPAFVKARTDRDSDEYQWFTWRSWPDEYEAYFDLPQLPQINTDYPNARDYLLRSIRYWVQEVGFDGLRLDHASGPSHDFWTDVRALIEEINSEAWIFGEITAPPAVLRSYAGRLHGALDFPLAQALRDTFGFSTMDFSAFDAFLAGHEYYFPAAFSLPSFLDNHDMDRFLWTADGDMRKLKLAVLCLLTLSGPPILYAGTEMGLSQRNAINETGSQGMSESRQPMPWDDPPYPTLYAYVRDLLHMRCDHPVIWRGERRTVHVDDATQTYAYVCWDADDAILVVFNRSEEAQTIALEDLDVALAPVSGEAVVLNAAQRQRILKM